MGYALSQLDKSNFKWFANDTSRNSLTGIKVLNGNIRGIHPCQIDFTYPVSAFVGENGSGKSTMLALAACAFHNKDVFFQFSRKKSYYTYGDFFTFVKGEDGLKGIEISYSIRQQSGDKPNKRWRKPSGKWNDFNTRENRNVVYLGINRITPPSESSAHRSYRYNFEKEKISHQILSEIKNMMRRIFGKNYSDLEVLVRNSYRLFFVKRNNMSYSGFNMGTGENAVISILLELLRAGNGSLMVIDELELGLHAKAQHEFVQVLKEICNKNKCQIICSTHSDIILEALPPEGRFFIHNKGSETVVTPEISTKYAFGRLAGQKSEELDVFVEDEVGRAIINNIIPMRIRERVETYVIGSDQAILKQIAARYREGKCNFIAFLDGDKSNEKSQQIKQIKNYLETRIDNEELFTDFITQRLCYLPGKKWPESSIIEGLLNAPDYQELSERWDIPVDDVYSYLELSLSADKHDEFFVLAKNLSIDDKSRVRNDCISVYKRIYHEQCQLINSQIDDALSNL